MHRQSVFLRVCVFSLARLISPARPLFQVTTNISSRSGAEDRRPGGPPEDESDAYRFCRNAEAAAAAVIGQATYFVCKLFVHAMCSILLAFFLPFVSLSGYVRRTMSSSSAVAISL